MKKINNKILIVVTVVIGLLSTLNIVNARQINFSDYVWDVKVGTGMGPGNNNWSDSDQDVFVDEQGQLHLKVAKNQTNEQWYSSEVTLNKSLGYGKYTFDFVSPVDQIDPNLVAAPFIYKDDQHELDIEYSYWKIPGSTNLHYTTQPLEAGQYNETNQLNQSIILNNSFSRNIIYWEPNFASFNTLDETGSNLGTEWKKNENGDGTINFQDDTERAHINFWQIDGLAPTNATTSELIVKSFSFVPYTAPTTDTDSSTSTTSTPATGTTTTTQINDTSNATTSEEFNIHVKIKTFDSPVYDKIIKVKNCEEAPNTSIFTMNAWCAIEQAVLDGNLSITNSWSDFGVFITSINQYNGNDGKWWLWYSDVGGLNPGSTALNKHLLQDGEAILLTYGISPLKITLSGDEPYFIYSTSTIIAQYFDDSIWDWKTTTDVNFEILHSELLISTTSVNGQFDLFLDSIDPFNIKVKKEGLLESDNFILEAVLPTTTINLNIYTTPEDQADMVYSDLNVTACKESDDTQKYTLNAKCALNTTNQSIDWSTWGTDMFLNSINSYQNNQNGNGVYWNWFSGLNNDLNYGQTALNKHILTANENLVLTYNVFPLKISTDSYTPKVGSTTTITLEEFSFDESFNTVWKKANSSTLLINKEFELINDSGTYYLPITSTEPIYIFGQKIGFANSLLLVLNPINDQNSTSTTSTNSGSSVNSSGGSSESSNNQTIINETINNAVNKLIDFLKSNQDNDGKIIDGNISDWAAMAFGAKNIYASDVKKGDKTLYDFIYNYNFTDTSEINICASYPRHILALLSSGVTPTDTKIVNLKNKINNDCIKDNKYGFDGINDDLFGLLAMLATNTDIESSVIKITIDTILSDQQTDGSFTWNGYAGADITGAVINGLVYAKQKGIIINDTIINKAKQYLKNQQLTDGGWGYETSDALTTSWTTMGINALAENQTGWFNNAGKNPWYILTTLDNDHYTQSWDGAIDWFGTKHAIPALLGKSWPIILDPKPNTNNQNNGGGSSQTFPTTTIITTSTLVTTTTTFISTSTTSTLPTITTPIVDTASSTTSTMAVTEKIKPQTTLLSTTEIVEPKKTFSSPIINNDKKDEEKNNNQELRSASNEIDKNQMIDNLPLDTPTKRTAKKVLAVSGGSALVVGAYLGLRLLRNVI